MRTIFSFLALLKCSDCLAYPDLFDNIQAPPELSDLFFTDGSWDTTSLDPGLEHELIGESNLDSLLADQSDACPAESFRTFGKRIAAEGCNDPLLQSPINVPKLDIDPQEFLDPLEFLEPDPDDMSLVYPFELPDGNDDVCPKPVLGRLYAVCDSGIESDNKYDEQARTTNLRYCTLYNGILGCHEPHSLWCCEFFYLDELGLESGIIREPVGVGRYCQRASFLKLFGLPIPGNLRERRILQEARYGH